MAIDEAFFIERRGVRMVLYGGLLQEAHQQGIESIDTELIQAPGPDNGEVAICKAVVTMGDGRKFSGIGDASDASVSANIKPHKIRMSETRAKARALRDAINVNVVAFEEVSDEETPSERPQAPRTAQDTRTAPRARQGQSSRGSDEENTKGGASKRSATALYYRVGAENGARKWQEENGIINEMTQAQVSKHLDELPKEGA